MGMEWIKELDAREHAQVQHALDYADHHASAGAPGHGQFLLIAKLAHMLDKITATTAAVTPNASINDAMSAIEDIAELTGWPCIDSDRAEDNFVMTFKRGGL